MLDFVEAALHIAWFRLARLQRDIAAEIAQTLTAYSQSGDWAVLVYFAPWAILFGMAHALTPGHNKTILALYVGGTGTSIGPALRTSTILSATHIGMSVVIFALSIPLISFARGESVRAMVLEDISQGLLGLVGLWLLWSAVRPSAFSRHGHGTFGFVAGLVPCPLTFMVLTFAFARNVPEAGLAFVVVMFFGVGLVLGAVSLLAVLANTGAFTALRRFPAAFDKVSRVVLAVTGLLFIALAIQQLLPAGSIGM